MQGIPPPPSEIRNLEWLAKHDLSVSKGLPLIGSNIANSIRNLHQPVEEESNIMREISKDEALVVVGGGMQMSWIRRQQDDVQHPEQRHQVPVGKAGSVVAPNPPSRPLQSSDTKTPPSRAAFVQAASLHGASSSTRLPEHSYSDK